MKNKEWHILRLGNWKVTVTSLPDSAAARRDNFINSPTN